jgi:hypothetical protein
MRGDRSTIICSGTNCKEADCCVEEPEEVPIEVVLDCDAVTSDQLDTAIALLKQQVAVETGLQTTDFTIELCNKEARHRDRDRRSRTRDVSGSSNSRSSSSSSNINTNRPGSRLRPNRATGVTTTMVIKLNPGLDDSVLGQARGTLVDDDNRNPAALDVLQIDPKTGNYTLIGNISATTTTTSTTTTVRGTVAPTEAIVLKPTTTRICIGLLPPYVRREPQVLSFLGGIVNLIPVTGQVQDERPVFDLNFNAKPNEPFATFSDLATASGFTLNDELAQYGSAQIQQSVMIDAIKICSAIANSTGLVNPNQLDSACAIDAIEVAIRFKQPECAVLDLLDPTGDNGGWNVPQYGDFSLMIAMIAFTFESSFTANAPNKAKVESYDLMESFLDATVRVDFPDYHTVQANTHYSTAINEVRVYL